MTRFLAILSTFSLLAIATLPAASAADWAQWRGPERTGHVAAGVPVPAALPADPKVPWHIAVGGGFASPVVAAGKVIYLDDQGGSEVVHATDVATGKELWQEKVFASHRDGFGIGPRCTPLVDENRVFVQSTKGELQCRNVEDGKLLWRTNFADDFGAIFHGEKGSAQGGSRHGNTGSPVIDGEHVIVQVGSPKGAGLVCFQKATGEVVWKSQDDVAAYAAPIVATLAGTRQVISFTVEGLIGLDAENGKLLWRVPFKTAWGRHASTPVVVDDLVVVGSHQIGLVGTRVAKEAGGWKATSAWTNKAAAVNFTSPVAVGHHLYGLGPSRKVFCVDLKTGEVVWEKSGWVRSSGDRAHASFLVMQSNILLLNDSGELILFAANPQEAKVISRVQVSGSNWCNPAYADGRLFLRDENELRCIELMK